ncbi:glutaredoxin family protein [Nodularia spumigena CS-591/04]|uniref:glutaredoxin family protein n=1 Tax=Nodularia spumigena TaxID=70799 RepID=UPI0023300BB5|nr:glutaredoxin family protein [Nodularia spumigena]MDB9320637.1 glutaredoxin family protein [Nodularia spumigena CS-591/07A]MDB9330144.1 glutaredoxin family protein [Nodularia spumigena CS-591/04]MDB9362867.1 glutaredoxin family protein [Nodularia spumigena CS-588/02]MDB9363864.1 glutaredoxin family protein [Nodularia spumigena CS-588/02A10]
MRLILYSKPGCHLCEGLQEKLEQVENLRFELEIRDITTREDWFLAYQYEVPVICLSNHPGAEDAEGEGIEERLPRPSPRASVQQLGQLLGKYFSN